MRGRWAWVAALGVLATFAGPARGSEPTPDAVERRRPLDGGGRLALGDLPGVHSREIDGTALARPVLGAGRVDVEVLPVSHAEALAGGGADEPISALARLLIL